MEHKVPGGYNGKVLRVNLTENKTTEEPIDDAFCRKYLGGAGFIAYYLLNELEPGIDPLGCDFVLVAVGRKSDTSFLAADLMENSAASRLLYSAGDVINGSFRQVGIAVGDGLRCAMDLVKKLGKQG